MQAAQIIQHSDFLSHGTLLSPVFDFNYQPAYEGVYMVKTGHDEWMFSYWHMPRFDSRFDTRIRRRMLYNVDGVWGKPQESPWLADQKKTLLFHTSADLKRAFHWRGLAFLH